MVRALAGLALLCCIGCGDDTPPIEAEPWPEADLLFRGDGSWLGAGGASSVDLGSGRTLWLFAASLVDATASSDRGAAEVVSNSLAIQEGADPSTATLEHFAGPFLPDVGDEWHWPLHGIRVGSGLTLLFARFRPTTDGLGFESVSWGAFRIANPDDDPDSWSISELTVPALPFPCAGPTTLLLHDGFVHAYCVQDSANHEAFLLRWSEADFVAGDLDSPEWAVEEGWATDAFQAVFDEAAADFTVSRDRFRDHFVLVQGVGISGGFSADALGLRIASGIDGPFPAAREFFHPAEVEPPDVVVQSVRTHPQLPGADLIATYIANADLDTVRADPELYWPRFVKLRFR
jgi:hypothetical protein